MLVAIDAGHGIFTAGRRIPAQFDPMETREWSLNNRVAEALIDELVKRGHFYTIVSDDTGAVDIPLSNRTKAANNESADLYLSIHHNAGIKGGSGGGTTVFYYPKEGRAAQAEYLYKCLVDRTKLVGNRATPVNPKKTFYVLTKTKMPAFLIENGFMDSSVDSRIITTEEHVLQTAIGLADFVDWMAGRVPARECNCDCNCECCKRGD